jgi:hypothetical protein
MTCVRRFLAPALLAGAAALAGAGCIVPAGPDQTDRHQGGGCAPDLIVDYELQDAAGAPVTCASAGAAAVRAVVDGVTFPVACAPDSSAGFVTVPLQGPGTYDVTIGVFDGRGAPLAAAQSSSFGITSCGDTETQTPAVLVVSPGAAAGATPQPDPGSG